MSATIQLVEHCKTLRLKIDKNVTYLPYLSELNGKYIKYIDVCDEVTEDEDGRQYVGFSDDLFLSLIEKDTNVIKYDNFSLENFCISKTRQNRLLLNFKVDMEQSFLQCNNTQKIGKYIYILVWYTDLGDVNKVTEGENGLYCANSFEVQLKEQKNFFPDNREIFGKKFLNFLLYAPDPQEEPIPPIPPIGNGGGETAVVSQNICPCSYPRTYNNNISIIKEQSKDLFITLVKNSTKIFDSVPLYLFLYDNVYNYLTFNKIEFDFTLSYVTIAKSRVDEIKQWKLAVMFNCIYED